MKSRPTPLPNHWIVHLDNSPRTRGAARWGAWLTRRAAQPLRLTALHSGELDDFRDDHPGLGSPLVRAREATAASLKAVHVRSAYDDIGVADTDSAVDALLDSTEGHAPRGLILGRNRPTETWTMVSLGAVTRRVLRSTNDPVFIVPPDYEPPGSDPTETSGPIVVGVTPTDDARAALAVAEALGRDLRLSVAPVHVIPNAARFVSVPAHAPTTLLGAGMPHATFNVEARAALEHWMHEAGIELALQLEVGEPSRTLERTAKRLGATMIVTGSRQMSTLERIFQRSVGSSVAATSSIPTLVVPPTQTSSDESLAS